MSSARAATWVIAVMAIATGIVAILQYLIYREQTDIIKTADRPNITLKGGIEFNKSVDNPTGFFLFPATFVNGGNTEAKATFKSTGGDDFRDFKFSKTGYTYSEWILGPKSEITLGGFFRQSPAQIKNTYINADRPFRVAGLVIYFDKIYNKERQTRFCVVAKYLTLDANLTTLSGIAEPCSEDGTNCIDDKCPTLEPSPKPQG